MSLDQLQDKARGAVVTLEKMTPAERKQNPTLTFGQNYNTFRDQVLEFMPHLSEALPSAVPVDSSYGDACNATYVELHTYYQQIYNLILEPIDEE